MPGPRALTTGIALLAAAGVLAGCGGDTEEEPGPTATFEEGESVEVVAREYLFDPNSIVVEGGGGPLELTLDNQGSIAHNLRVLDGEAEVGGTPTLPGGESRSGRVALDPGVYRLVCTVADHEALGMVGELEVR